MKRGICLLAILPALLLAAGCGGDDDSLPETPVQTETDGSPSPLSKEDFISQADAICAEVNAAVGTLDVSSTDPATTIAQRADLYEGMIERIRSLGTQEGDSGLSDFLAAGDELVQAEQDAQLAANRGDDTALAAAESDAAEALSSFQAAAETYGFEDCGQGPSAPTTTTGAGVPPAAAPVTPAAPAPTTPVTPVTPTPTPTPAPTPTAPPTGGSGTGGGASTGGSGGSTGGSTGGGGSSGGIGPG